MRISVGSRKLLGPLILGLFSVLILVQGMCWQQPQPQENLNPPDLYMSMHCQRGYFHPYTFIWMFLDELKCNLIAKHTIQGQWDPKERSWALLVQN